VQGQFAEDPDQPGGLGGSVSDSIVWARLLAPNLDYDRRAPFQLSVAFDSLHRYKVHLPPGFELTSPPSNRAIVSKWGAFHLEVKKPAGDNPRHIELIYHTRIDQVRVEPADFEEFRKFREEVGRAFRTWLTFAPAPAAASDPLSDE